MRFAGGKCLCDVSLGERGCFYERLSLGRDSVCFPAHVKPSHVAFCV